MVLNKFSDIVAMLKDGGIESPRLEASILVEFVGENKPFEEFSLEEKETLFNALQERLQKKPVCKIVGSKGFYKYDFFVTEDVLSPRPDTELLVEKAIDIIQLSKFEEGKLLEFGVGSGCVVSSIVAEFPKLKAYGLELSPKAIEVAQKNIDSLSLKSQITLVQGSWFDDDLFEKISEFDFDMIVSNPPYIPSEDVSNLEEEVKCHDPLLALDGGRDGLRDYRKIAEVSYKLLKIGGYVLLEIGIGQTKDVVEIFEKQSFILIGIAQDLAGIERCIIFKK